MFKTPFAGILLIAASATFAQEPRREPVSFPAGQQGTTIEGSIQGYNSVLYSLGAEAGQRLSIRLSATNGATYFNLYAPGKGPGDEALATGQLTGPMVPDLNWFDGALPVSGDYRISVFMMRSAARREEQSTYRLEIALSGATNEVVTGDFADGLAGGPDFWQVAVTGHLNLRRAPSAGASIVAEMAPGTVLHNLGCRMSEGQRWCRVELPESDLQGWAAGAYLVEGAAPALEEEALAKEPETRDERVTFARGKSGIGLSGLLNGGDAVNYLLKAAAGQRMSVVLKTQAEQTRFNVFDPNGQLVYESRDPRALYQGELATDGDYQVTVYSTAPRDEVSRFELVLTVE